MRIISIISKELKCVKEDISFNLATLNVIIRDIDSGSDLSRIRFQ